MQKHKKGNWKRPVAGLLAVLLATGTIDISQFASLTSYAYSKDYGICTDNHLYSDTGANCNADQYVCVTKPTQGLTHGTPEWKEAIEFNKQKLLETIGNGDERTVMKTLWATIATIVTTGAQGGMSQEAINEAKFWANEIEKNVKDSVSHRYWASGIPTSFSPLTETELGIVRHGTAGEAIIQRDQLLAALCDFDHLFPGNGQSIANEPGQGWTYDAHWLMPRMGTGWRQSYTADEYGEGGYAQWPVDMQNHIVSVPDGQEVTLEMVQQNALAIKDNAAYYTTGKLDSKKNLIKNGSGSSSSKPGSDDGDEDLDNDVDDSDDTGASNIKKTGQNTYYINMSEWFYNNAASLKLWNGQMWQNLSVLDQTPVQIGSWTIQGHPASGDTAPYFEATYNGTGTAPALYGYFEIPKGSFVSVEDTTWDSPLDFAADIMEVYKCALCPTNRRPTDKHQTFVKVHQLPLANTYPCFVLGASTDPNPFPTELHFCVFRHQEDWQTDYNVQLDKKDYETGEPLEGSVFNLYEKFDDQDEINTDNDGAVQLYEGSESGEYPDNDWQSGYTSSPVLWDDFRKVNSYTTDGNGHIETDVPKNYHYEKTYCDGHPAPKFTAVPELESDPETGEDNSDEVKAAKEQNRAAAKKWIGYYEGCQEKAEERDGVHFHWLGDGVDESKIREIAGSGGDEDTTPNGGPTECFDKEASYEGSGCKQDTEDTYDKFISLKYTYTWKEEKAREGYIVHDTHTDDVLIEAITTDSSQNGANSTFAIGDEKYDKFITINDSVNAPVSAGGDDEGSTTMLSLLSSAFAVDTDETDDNSAYMLEPYIREDYGFEKTGFSAFKEKILDAVKFLTGSFATPSNATDSEAEEDEDDNITVPDLDLFGKAENVGTAIKDGVSDLLTIKAYAAEGTSAETEEIVSAETETETAEGTETEAETESKETEKEKQTEASVSSETTVAVEKETFASAETQAPTEESAENKTSEKKSFLASILNFRGLSAEDSISLASDDDDDGDGDGGSDGSADFESVFEKAFTDAQTDDFAVELGPEDNWSHCDDRDGEGNAWRVYDHRTEGEIHFNKRDLNLDNAQSEQFDSYAQENGDGSLEGAVYGLFADEDIVHPDGKTGTVYKEGDLVAVATTDRNGDGSFMAYTEAPGVVYNYKTGKIEKTAWYDSAPKNRFREDAKPIEEENHAVVNDFHDTSWTVDDYTDDKGEHIIAGRTERVYDANEENNGNSWIGRPLILGKYYIKELSRSEGYELSVNGKANAYTNYDPENPDSVYEVNRAEDGKGTVSVSRNLYINGQEAIGAENEPFFNVTSDGTVANGGFDIVVSKMPQGTEFYRQDSLSTQETTKQQIGWEVVNKTDANGNIIYKRASSDTSDPIYVGDGTYTTLTEKIPATIGANNVAVKKKRTFSQEKIDNFLRGNSAVNPDGTVYYPDQVRLSRVWSSNDWGLMKAKLETAIRGGGSVTTPSTYVNGKKTFSSENYSVYSRGVRKGEVDIYGVSGVNPGEIAKTTAYGPQIVKVTISKAANGQALTTEDMIRNLIQYYIDNPQYNFGGLDSYKEHSDRVDFYLYASDLYTTDGAFATVSDDGNGYDIYVRKEFVPNDTNFEPYYVYVKYTEDGNEDDAFGYYTNLKTATSSSYTYLNAMCTPDSVVNGDGSIMTKYATRPKYYKKGEFVYDKDGNKVPETERVPKYGDVTSNVLKTQWAKLDAAYDAATGNYVIHIDMPYTDSYGNVQTDADKTLDIALKAVCPKTKHTLTQDDWEALSRDNQERLQPGDQVSSGFYEVEALNAKASVYLDYAKKQEAKKGTYVADAELTYPGQDKTFQDGTGTPGHGTMETPIPVQERPIRQKVKVFKDIQTLAEPKNVWYCLNCGTENEDGRDTCETCGHERTTEETKTIKYAHDTYSAVHSENISAKRDAGLYDTVKDWLTKLMGGEVDGESATDIPNFRFKAYLKSNLERLYRDEDGNIVWMDRNGNVMTPQYEDTNGDGNYDTFTWKYADAYTGKTVNFPEKDKTNGAALDSANVQKIYTEILHKEGSKTTSARANNVWAEYGNPQTGGSYEMGEKEGFSTSERTDAAGNPGDASGEAVRTGASLYQYTGKNTDVAESDRIHDTENAANSPTRLLETTLHTVEDGTGTRDVEEYNYEKFFDAMQAANTDIWDDDMHSTFTGDAMANYPGQHWFETFYEKYQKDDAEPGHTMENTDGTDQDGTAGGDHDTSFKPFRWIREKVFGDRADYEKYPAEQNGVNIETVMSTSDYARANAEASDAVRQFATKWYLKQEAAKLMTNNGNDENISADNDETIKYDEEVYDHALFEAIAKSYNYLKPFYTYDLDTIYSVEWDSAENGGSDSDVTTLSIDFDDGDEHSAISAYLPYGTYVIVEQQPARRDGSVNDWENRSYSIEKPKEVLVPSLYDAGESNDTTDNYNAHYSYDETMPTEEQAKAANYMIRFGEEWSDEAANAGQDERHYVIRAHNYYGDYEIYKYGLDIDLLNSGERGYDGIHYGDSFLYNGWKYTQEETDPLKDYYDTEHRGEAGTAKIGTENGGNNVSDYMAIDRTDGADTANGTNYDGKVLQDRFFYAGISEDRGAANDVMYKGGQTDDNNASGMQWKDGVVSMTGELTAYSGRYAQMLVPWTVTEPADAKAYDASKFNGYADVNERNGFFTTFLRINKTDSETGEYILHDDAIFALYAGSRYQSFEEIEEDAKLITDTTEREKFLAQFKPGDAKFYLQDTMIEGSMEFLKAMGAHDIKAAARGRSIVETSTGAGETYTGIVPKGTPICVESERIMLTDKIGNRTGQMTVYSTMNDVEVTTEENADAKEYVNQNTGYFVTPQPIGAGVYVLAEIKAPAGYVRSKPVAYEVYSDKTSYYVDGDMYSKTDAVRYEGNLLTDINYKH